MDIKELSKRGPAETWPNTALKSVYNLKKVDDIVMA